MRFSGLAPLGAALALVACSGRAGLRRVEHLEASGNLELDARYQRFERAPEGTDLRDTASAGVGIRAIVGKRAGLMFGADTRIGGGLQGGLAYRATLRPLGAGVHVGRFATLGANAGVGIDGVTGHVGFAVRLPLEIALTIAVARRVHLAAWSEVSWISAEDSRESGSGNAPFGDELAVGGALRIGRGGSFEESTRWGNGYFVGATYSELLGVERFGLMFGYGVSAHYRPR